MPCRDSTCTLCAWLFCPGSSISTPDERNGTVAGLCGVCLYYLLENMALIETQASNVGVIISIAPFFTAIVTQITARGEERMCPTFFIGFAAAMTGIGLISFNGAGLEMNPQGDLLAVMAAFVWACYSVLVKKVGSFGYHVVQSTRRIFAYGQLFMIPALFPFGFRLDLSCLSGRPLLYLCSTSWIRRLPAGRLWIPLPAGYCERIRKRT